jgi:hypothetical protein
LVQKSLRAFIVWHFNGTSNHINVQIFVDVCQGIDFVLNQTVICPVHFAFAVGVLSVYFAINCVSRFVIGKPVYEHMTYDNVFTYLVIVGGYIVLALIFMALYKAGQLKQKYLKSKENEKFRDEPIDEVENNCFC